MPLNSLHNAAPIRRTAKASKPNYEVLEDAIARFVDGDHQGALAKTLAHLFPDRAVPDVRTESFTFPQGSARVTISLDGDALRIVVPLCKLSPESNVTALLRFLLTKISGSGQLHQPRLRGDEVYLEFDEAVSRLHPTKLIEVLRRMPVEADSNDDWLIDQFAALPLDRQPIAALDDGELDRAERAWRSHFREVEELLKEAQRKRSMFFLNEVCSYATHHLRYALPVGGFLLGRLIEASAIFDDGDADPMRRESALGKCARDMLAVSRDDLKRSLGHAEYAISPLAEGTTDQLAKYVGDGDYADAVARTKASGKVMDAAVALTSTYTYLLARFTWDPEVEAALLEALAEASDKPWREAANILSGRGKTLVERLAKEAEDPTDESGQPEASS